MPFEPSQLKELTNVVAIAVVSATAFVIVVGMILKSHRDDIKTLKEIIEKKDEEQKEINRENGEMHKGKLLHFSEENQKRDEMIMTIVTNHLEKSAQSNEKLGEMIRNTFTKFSETINNLSLVIERGRYKEK